MSDSEDGGSCSEEKQVFLEDGSCNEVSLSAQFQTEVSQAVTAKPNKPYAIYVLMVLTIIYMVNQLDKFALSVVAKPIAQDLHYGNQECVVDKKVKDHFIANNHLTNDQISQWKMLCNNANESFCSDACITFTLELANKTICHVCSYEYDGTGYQYQLVAGPVFDNIFAVSAIIMGILADFHHTKLLLCIFLVMWSVLIGITGFVKEYWQLVLTRFGVAIGSAGCTPFAACIIVNYFSKSLHGVVLGIYNWGIYLGYGAAFAVGNQVAERLSWHWVFYISGLLGLAIAPILLFTVKEPKRQVNEAQKKKQLTARLSFKDRTLLLLLIFLPKKLFCGHKRMAAYPQMFSPGLWLLLLAGSIRNAGGYVWGYNAQLFYTNEKDLTNDQISEYMSWVIPVGGITGAFLGGLLADLIARYGRPHYRIWVLAVSQMIAAPFAAGALFLSFPWCFISLLPAFAFGEMWIGVTIAMVVDIVPVLIQGSVIAVYLFIITIIGGNFNILVTVFVQAGLDREWALLITFPGLYMLSSFLFIVTFFVLRCEIVKAQTNLYVNMVAKSE